MDYLGLKAATSNRIATFSELGSITISLSTKTANYTIVSGDDIILGDAGSGAIQITLPTAVGITKLFRVKRINSGANIVTIGTTASQTIDGSTTVQLKVQYQSLTFASNNANWFII